MPVKPTSFVEGQWRRLLSNERLRRSSQVVSVVDQTVCIFGGEVQPRQPVDNQIDVFSLTSDSLKLDTKSIFPAPSPRVGSASAVLNGKMYLFSGRGGTDMAPIEEMGTVWSFNPVSSSWSSIKPQDLSKPYPPAWSYHCSTSDGQNSIFVHAGCPSKGRLSDLWKFNVSDQTWTRLADAPAPQRGGASIACSGASIFSTSFQTLGVLRHTTPMEAMDLSQEASPFSYLCVLDKQAS